LGASGNFIGFLNNFPLHFQNAKPDGERTLNSAKNAFERGCGSAFFNLFQS